MQLGCSWHKCAFCDFTRDHFELLPLEDVRRAAEILGELKVEGNRVFLLGQNPFCRSTSDLLHIFGYIHHYLPWVSEISMYARADDILRKSPEDLRTLRQMGLRDLHVGVESGSDTVLLMANKGETAADLLRAFRKLDEAGIQYLVTSILGLGGKQMWKSHAIETARLYNQIHPRNIWVLALKLFPGTQLYRQANQGLFEPMTPWQMLREERLLVQCLEVKDCFYMDTTALNQYTLAAHLPDGKEGLLQAIHQLLVDEELPVGPGSGEGGVLSRTGKHRKSCPWGAGATSKAENIRCMGWPSIRRQRKNMWCTALFTGKGSCGFAPF